MGQIIAGIIILLVVVLIVLKLIRDKKQGKSSCGCGCSACGSDEICHPHIHGTEESKEEKNRCE